MIKGSMLYVGLGLQLQAKTPKRRVKAKLPDDPRSATRSNETWAMDSCTISLQPAASCAC
jgi:hypothetical protein